MDLESARTRCGELRKEIERHRKLYFDDNNPEISATAYEILMTELEIEDLYDSTSLLHPNK